MEQKGELISYRPDIKVVDCTIRDGGLVNNFYFDDEFVRNLYTANVAAGVEYMEFGYKASKEIFDVKEFGKWKFCDEQDIRDIVGDNNTDLKISVMADVGRTDYKKDIIPFELRLKALQYFVDNYLKRYYKKKQLKRSVRNDCLSQSRIQTKQNNKKCESRRRQKMK